MADEKIVTNVVATSDFSGLIADVQRTTAALSKLQQELSLSNKTLASQAGQIQKAFGETLRSTGQFTTHFVTVGSEVENFGKKLDTGKLKLRDYFQTWQNHTKTSGGLIRDLAKQQVALQQAIVQPLGKSADGLMKFNVNVANGLDEIKNKTAIARKEMQIYNKVIQDGGVQLINWGKNTQWAGRQLTVGLTVPLAAFGAAAAKAFREADQELVRLQKVYGGLSAVSAQELAKVRKDVSDTARELSSMYGSSYKETIGLAADIAATGKQGNELLESTKEATRLAILGEVDRQEAMKATLAIQSAFKQNTTELSKSINFLNAVENQTSTSLADLVEAIPKAGPVVKALGGDIEDLALYLTAMREGGINASEGANALKSALASIINPTKVAKEQFMGFGINLEAIVTKNSGNLTQTILEIQSALETLDPLKKSQAIEQLFGKFQFARMNALFENLGKQGSQTLQVLDLMKASSQDLASVAGRELSQITESASGQYKRAIESLKADLAGLGDQFLKIGTFFVKVVDGVIKFVTKMPDPIKSLLGLLGGITALAGPLIMLTGVFANFIGYVIKGIGHIRALGKGGEGFKLLTPQILAAEQAGSLIEKTFYSDAKAAQILTAALSSLTNEYTILQQKAMAGSISAQPLISTLQGNVVVEGAERIADPTSKYIGKPYSRQMSHTRPVAGMTADEKAAQNIFGVVPGAGPVNQRIGKNPQMYMSGDLPRVPGLTEVSGVSTGIVAQEAAKWHSMTAALAMQSEEEIKMLKREVAATGAITTELSTSYQALLPKMTNITSLAAQESGLIVADLQASKITVDQARAKVIELNARIEAMMAQTANEVALSQGRTANLTMVPLTGQPVVDPVTGKSNMKEMFHKSKTSQLVDKIARSLGVRTSGGGYSVETTKPKRLNAGGPVSGSRGQYGNEYNPSDHGAIVPGPNVNYDVIPGRAPVGGFVLNKEASAANPDLVNLAAQSYSDSGSTTPVILTPGETVVDPKTYQNNKDLYDAANATRMSLGGRINAERMGYGALNPMVAGYLKTSSMFGGFRSKGVKYWRASKNKWDTHGTTTAAFSERGSGSVKYSDVRSKTSSVYNDPKNAEYGITPVAAKEVLVHAFNPSVLRRLKKMGYSENDYIPREVLQSLNVPVTGDASGFKVLPTTWVKNFEKFNQSIKHRRPKFGENGWLNTWRPQKWDDMQSLLIKLKDMGVPPAQAKVIAREAANKLNRLVEAYDGPMSEAKWGSFINTAEISAIRNYGLGSKNPNSPVVLPGPVAHGQQTFLGIPTRKVGRGWENPNRVQTQNYQSPLPRGKAASGPLASLPKHNGGGRIGFNAGGIVPGYALGGKIMRGKKNYGYTALRSKIRGTGTIGQTKFDEDGNPIINQNSGMATSMAGMAMMMGGSQMPGMAGQAMTFAGMGMQMAPMLKMMTPMLKGMSTLSGLMLKVKTIGMSAFTALRIGLAALISPVGLISVAIGGLVALFLKMKREATNAGEVNRATFGLTSSALEEVGIKYKTLSERIKEANDQLELNRARVRSSFEGYTKSGVPGLDLTLKELKEGVANAKKEDKESVGLFDKAKATQVNQLAASMKAQYVALGMSVQEATNQVYILIKASNKSSQALNAISSEEFKNISDRASAATYSVEMLAKVLSDKGLFNAEEFTRGLDNMLNSLDAYKNSLMETTKTQTGVSEAEALKETMEQIKKVGGDRAKLDEKTLQALKEQDIRLGYILGKAETLASVFAKTQLLFSGMASDINIKSLSPEQATKALEGYQQTKVAADVILGKTAISAAAKAAEDASENAIKVLKNAEKADNSYIDTAIKNKQKLIKQLEEERNARLKILDLQEKSASFETNIKQAQIKYQEALAAGDMAQAAQEQLNIQQLSGDRQRELARQSINDKADAERKKLEEEIERLQALKDAQAKALVSAQNTAVKKQENAATLTGFLNEIKDAIAGFGGNKKDDAIELKELLSRITDSGRKGMVDDLFKTFGVDQGDKNPYGQLLEKLKKSTDIELKGSQYDKFDSAVKAFQDAVNKFAGIGQGSFAEPINAGTTAGQLGKGDIKWGDKYGPGSSREQVKAFAKKKGYTPGTQFTLRENDGTVKQFLVLEDGNIQLQKETKPSGRAQGGLIKGPGTGTSDSIAAMVMPPTPGFAGGGMPIRISDGEYIIKASTVQKYGVDFFDQLNAQRFAGGGRAKRKKNNVVYIDPQYASSDDPYSTMKLPISKNQMVNLRAALSYLTKETGVKFKIAGSKTSPKLLEKAIKMKMYDKLGKGQTAGYWDGDSVNIGNVDALNKFSFGRSGSTKLIAHELIHAMGDSTDKAHSGSEHTKNPFDLMFSQALPFQQMSKASVNVAKNYAKNFAGGGMMTMPKYAMGGMPRYNIPTDSLSVANKPFNSYANGGSAVYNNAFTINAAEGQDTRMIAMQAVQLMQKQGSKTFSEQGSPGARLI